MTSFDPTQQPIRTDISQVSKTDEGIKFEQMQSPNVPLAAPPSGTKALKETTLEQLAKNCEELANNAHVSKLVSPETFKEVFGLGKAVSQEQKLADIFKGLEMKQHAADNKLEKHTVTDRTVSSADFVGTEVILSTPRGEVVSSEHHVTRVVNKSSIMKEAIKEQEDKESDKAALDLAILSQFLNRR